MKLTQRDRVLNALRGRGHHGLTQVDFLGPTCDGGKPITRVASRIDELRARGYVITTSGRRDKCVVYVLVREPASALPTPTAPAGLFDTAEAASPRCALFDDEAAA